MWNEIDPIRRQGVNLSTVTSSIILCIHTFQETDYGLRSGVTCGYFSLHIFLPQALLRQRAS